MSKKAIKIVASVSILTLIIISTGLYIVNTPQYSLYKMGRAINNRNYSEFSKYFDTKAVATSLMDRALSKVMQEPLKNDDSFGILGAGLAKSLVDSLKPSIVEGLEAQIKASVEKGEMVSNGSLGKDLGNVKKLVSDIKITKDGQNTKVTINSDSEPVTLVMKKVGTNWQVFDMDINLDSVDSLVKQDLPQQGGTVNEVANRVKFGDRVDIGDSWFLTVNRPEAYVPSYISDEDSDKKFWAVNILYENNGSTTDNFNPNNFKMKDNEDFQYDSWIVYGKEPILVTSDVEPQEKVRGYLTFMMPANSQVKSIIYSGNTKYIFE